MKKNNMNKYKKISTHNTTNKFYNFLDLYLII